MKSAYVMFFQICQLCWPFKSPLIISTPQKPNSNQYLGFLSKHVNSTDY